MAPTWAVPGLFYFAPSVNALNAVSSIRYNSRYTIGLQRVRLEKMRLKYEVSVRCHALEEFRLTNNIEKFFLCA